MATVSTALKMFDQMTRPLQQVTQALNLTISAMDDLVNSANSDIRITNTLDAAKGAIQRANIGLQELASAQDEVANNQNKLNDSFNRGISASDGLTGKIKGMIGAYMGIGAVKKTISTISGLLGSSDITNAAQTQLAIVMRNMGATKSEFEMLKRSAANIQSKTTFGDETLLAGAGELATYLKSGEAINAMMGTLANYATGMGGMNVDNRGMVEYATQIGKALDGQFDGLAKKGFQVTDAQKAIIENGTEMERVAVITDIINQSWQGLSETMAKTPQGVLLQISNTFDGIKQEVGNALYPAVLKFFNTLNSNMPQVKTYMMGFAYSITVIIELLGNVINVTSTISSFFINNWGIIAPIIWGVVAALGMYVGYLIVTNGLELISKGIKIASTIASYAHAAATGTQASATAVATAAQYGLNTALLACPITWIILGIIALIAVFYAAVGAVNHFAGTSISATGLIVGSIAFAGAVIWNIVIGLINSLIQAVWTIFCEPFIGIIGWVLNAANGGFNSFGDGVANLIGQIISWFLSLGKVVTKIIDAIFNTNWTVGLSSLQDSVLSWGKNNNAITVDHNMPTIGSRIDYGNAWNAGYGLGENIGNKFNISNLLGGMGKTSSEPQVDLGAWNNNQVDNFGGVDDLGKDSNKHLKNIDDKIDVSNEHLEMLRDLAEQESIQNFVTLTPTVQVTTGDIREEADINKIISKIEDYMENELVSSAEGVYA